MSDSGTLTCDDCGASLDDYNPEQLKQTGNRCLDCIIAEVDEAIEQDKQLSTRPAKSVQVHIGKLPGTQSMTAAQEAALVNTDPLVQASLQVSLWGIGNSNSSAPLTLADLAEQLEERVRSITDGDSIESIVDALALQAITLETLGHSLLRRANVTKHQDNFDTACRYGLRALSQSRSSLESIAALKRPVTRQTNIAHGHQQVNNIDKAITRKPTKGKKNRKGVRAENA